MELFKEFLKTSYYRITLGDLPEILVIAIIISLVILICVLFAIFPLIPVLSFLIFILHELYIWIKESWNTAKKDIQRRKDNKRDFENQT